ncbi:MAG: hypothetical protein H3C35_01300 [Bacteroidetes bacterium]|nr:hypothetical protein [Bacteroidota bacterium]
MKKIFLLVIAVTMLAGSSLFSQFKNQTEIKSNVSDSFIKPEDSWFSFFNPNNFQMHHAYSMSYMTAGGKNLALQRYTNTMLYQFAPNLYALVDISLQNSPFSSFDFRTQQQFNSLSISRAEITYQPWKNTFLRLSYQQNPYGLYDSFYNPYSNWFTGLQRYEGE